MRQLAMFFLVFASFIACKKDNKLYSGDTQIGFGTTVLNDTIPFFSDSYSLIVPLQIIGKTPDEIVSCTINTSEENSLFSIKNKTVTFDKTFTADATIEINGRLLGEGNVTSVTLSILSSDKASIAKNYSTCKITARKQRFAEVFSHKYLCKESATQLE